MARDSYINLCVKDLPASKAFFTELGFMFNPRFTNDAAACMILNPHAYVMLLREEFFKTFTRQELCDTSRATEAIIAVSCDDRAQVDGMLSKAVALGGRPAMPVIDHGFMYGCSFYDLDGHHWEAFWMDPKGPTP